MMRILQALMGAPGEGPWSPRRALFYRGIFLAGTLALAYFLAYVFNLSLHPVIFLGILAWYLTFPLFFLWWSGHPGSRWFLPVRCALFVYEIALLTVGAHFVGGIAWLGILLLLFATIEWNLQFPGALGAAGSGLAVVAIGALTLAETRGWVEHHPLFPATELLYGDPAYAVSTFLASAAVILGISVQAGNYASELRRKRAELEALNTQLRRASEDLRHSHAQLEAAYAELRNMQAQAVQSARMASLGRLLAGVTHELNTPLGAIRSNRDVLRRALARLSSLQAEPQVASATVRPLRDLVKAVEDVLAVDEMAVGRIVGLVGSLRSFGRPEEAEIKRVDLHEGLESTLTLLGHELKDRITVERQYGDLPEVECFPNQVNQVFMNLLLNAAQAIAGSGTITVRTYSTGEEVAVEIRDTGVGIPRENLSRIFEPGFTTKGSRVGMGLGLLISSQIVERHRGRIEVESEPGKGSTFRVWLPVRLSRPTSEREA